MKKGFFIAVSVLLSMFTYAQTVQDAQKEIDNENYFKARGILLKLLNDPAADKTEVAYYIGNAFLKNEDPDSAKIFYKMAVNPDPKNASFISYLASGRLALLAKDTTQVSKNFTRALQLTKSKNANVFYEIGDAYFRPAVFNLSAATSNLEEAHRLDSKNTTIMLELGDAHLENSTNDNSEGGKAMNLYEDAVQINDKLALGYIKMGRLDMGGRIYDQAIENFNKALQIDQRYPVVHKELGQAYYYTHQYDKMIQEFQTYINLSPGDTKARISLLTLLWNNKDYQKCADEAAKGLKSEPNNIDYLRYLIYSDYELKNYKDGYDAMQQLRKVPNIQLKPRDIIYAARLANSQGDTTQAFDLFSKAIANDSANCDLLGEYAKALYIAKHYDEASKQYVNKKNRCGDLSSLDIYYLGRAYLIIDDSINADTTFGEFIKRNPTSPDGYFWRARTNLKIGKLDDFLSLPYYQKYIEVASSDLVKYKANLVEAYIYLGTYYMEKQKDKAKAKESFEKAHDIDPNDQDVNEYLKQINK